MRKLKLGQKITFNQILKRTFPENYSRKFGDPNKIWIEKPFQKAKGIIVGVRTLFDSYVDHFDEYTSCTNSNPQTALFVSYDLKRKPVFIPYYGHLITYKFVDFNPIRKMRGAKAASLHLFIDGESNGYVWMNQKDIKNTIRDFGDSPELQKSLRCYQ